MTSSEPELITAVLRVLFVVVVIIIVVRRHPIALWGRGEGRWSQASAVMPFPE